MGVEDRASADDFEEVDQPALTSTSSQPTSLVKQTAKPNNAFTELMKPKPKPSQPRQPDRKTEQTCFLGRDGLGAYSADPSSFPRERVIQYDDEFVVIRDLFPKATVHLLILPRDKLKNIHRGQEAFDDTVFLDRCRAKEKEVRCWVAEELRSRFGKGSASETARRKAMEEAEDDDDDGGGGESQWQSEESDRTRGGKLPPGRDWQAEVISGVHAIPSMNHLHIHVLSRDMDSDWMKKPNHYLSFTTDFLIPLSAFPLEQDDYRRQFGHWSDSEMKCWRCGMNLGSGAKGMRRVKAHLEEELEEWRRE